MKRTIRIVMVSENDHGDYPVEIPDGFHVVNIDHEGSYAWVYMLTDRTDLYEDAR